MTHNIPVNQNLVDMEYAVRGPIPLRAMDLQKEVGGGRRDNRSSNRKKRF